MKKIILILVIIFGISGICSAKGAGQFMDLVRQEFPPAQKTTALKSASVDLELSTINSFAVLKQGGIPAEKAAHFISWGEYDYRGTEINLEKNSVSTRRGKVYTYLRKGDILAVADVFSLGRKIYFTLITPEPYIPVTDQHEKRHSRVTLTLVFKMPKEVRNSGDSQKAFELITEWIEPFKSYDDAKKYSETLIAEDAPKDVQKAKDNKKEIKKTKEESKVEELKPETKPEEVEQQKTSTEKTSKSTNKRYNKYR